MVMSIPFPLPHAAQSWDSNIPRRPLHPQGGAVGSFPALTLRMQVFCFPHAFWDSPDFAQGVQFWFLLCTYFPEPYSGLEWPWKPQTLRPVISPVPDVYYVPSMWRYPFLLLSSAIYIISNNTCLYFYMFGNVAFN